MNIRWGFVAVVLLLVWSGHVSAFGVWEPAADPIAALEDAIQHFEQDLVRAVDSRSAHPDFIAALEGHVSTLYAILADLRGSEASATGDWSGWEPPDFRAGNRVAHSGTGVEFLMRLAPAASFPSKMDDSGEASVNTPFWIAETQVTYELWYTVRQWALGNGYGFENAGVEGSEGTVGRAPTAQSQEPVTRVSWRDSIVWCNALSEMLGFDPVYTYQGRIIRDSSNAAACDNAVQTNADGFRLPTSDEWELAARYQGVDSTDGSISRDGLYWTPGDYASGAAASVSDGNALGAVAWYVGNSGGRTHPVASKVPNELGLYDMSGNVREWVFTATGSNRVYRGGGWGRSYRDNLQVGNVSWASPDVLGYSLGLRIARTAL